MALQKTINTNYNANATYWKITNINIDYLRNSSVVVLEGYTDKQTRDELKSSLSSFTYNWCDLDFPFEVTELNGEGKNPLSIAYIKIKEVSPFIDAKNV